MEELEQKIRRPKQISIALVEEQGTLVCMHAFVVHTSYSCPLPLPLAGDLETTLAIVKPDAVSKGFTQSIRHIIQQDGFRIIREAKIKLSLTDVEQFYKYVLQKHCNCQFLFFLCSNVTLAFLCSLSSLLQRAC